MNILIYCRKGKLKPLEIVEKDPTGRYLHLFTCMGDVDGDENIQVASEFVCQMYSQPKAQSVDKARYSKLVQMSGKVHQVCWRAMFTTKLLLF